MFARAGFEELIASLLQIDRRSARHVIEVIALAIPRKRWAHGYAIARMEKIIRPGKVLSFRKRAGGITKVWRVIVKKITAILARSAARKCGAHREHRLYRRRFYAQRPHAPGCKRVIKAGAGSRLGGNQFVPHRASISVEGAGPLSRNGVCVKVAIRREQLAPRHPTRNL